MKDKIADAFFVGFVGWSTIVEHGLTLTAGALAVFVGVMRAKIALRQWRQK